MRKVAKYGTYAVIFTQAEEGGYTATVPELSGCISEGDTFELARKNIAEAIELYLEVKKPKDRTFDRQEFVVAPVSV